jgi:uncharacterized membrane protein YoaK (UPF0700 family)
MHLRWLALLLAAVAGSVDAVAITLLARIATNYMSGNSVSTVTSIVLRDPNGLLPALIPIPMFALGVFVASTTIEIGVRRNSRAPLSLVLACEATLIATAMLLGGRHTLAGSPFDDPVLYVIASLAAISMGMQNTTLRDSEGRLILTTFLTGSLIFAMEEIAASVFQLVSPVRNGSEATLSPIAHWRPNANRLKLYGGMYCAYLAGAASTVLIGQILYFWAWILPVSALVVALAWNIRRPLYVNPLAPERAL